MAVCKQIKRIVDKTKFASLIETLEILSDPKLMRQIRQSKKEMKAGKFLTHEEVFE